MRRFNMKTKYDDEVGNCINCDIVTFSRNTMNYYECLECRCVRIATMEQLNNNINLTK